MLPGEQIWSELAPRLQAIYPSLAPVIVAQAELGPDAGGPPLSRIVAYAATEPSAHWHFVTCGLSASRFIPGYPAVGDRELSFRLGRLPGEKTPPAWVAPFLQQLGRDAFSSDDAVEVGSTLNLEAFWQQAHDTALTAGHYIEDPLVPAGPIQLVQLVALTLDERNKVASLSTGRSELVLELTPAGISDLSRALRARAAAASARPPPPPPLPGLSTLAVTKVENRMRVSLAPAEVPAFVEIMKASLRGRCTITSKGWTVHIALDEIARSATWATTLAIFFTLALSKQVAIELADPGRHGQPLRYDALPDLELFVEGVAPKKEAPPKTSVLKKLGNFFGMP